MAIRDHADCSDESASGASVLQTGSAATAPITLPPKVPKQPHRPAQSNIPDEKRLRMALRKAAAQYAERVQIIPPLTMDELFKHSERIRAQTGVDPVYHNYISILLNNEAWRDTVAQIPYDRRLLLLAQCLRADGHCRAEIDEFGLLCEDCGSCSISDLTAEAERLGYAVLVAEGSAIVTKLIETGRIEAIIGVSCMNVLEKCFPHMEERAVPGIAIPLLQDGCVNTTVDLEWVRDAINLTSGDKSHRLDLDAIKRDVQSWFTADSLDRILGPAVGETEPIAREWLSKAGKRWRPYLTVCLYLALQSEKCDMRPSIPLGLKKLAVAVECFHKASLIHDDIEDDDKERYGLEALHVEYGMPVALNVGDFLLGEGYRLIGELDVAAETKVGMLRTAAAGHLTLSRGQGAELCWARDPKPLSSLEVLDILRQKTAPAFEVALRLGAFYGNAENDIHSVLSDYSESLGIAYQIRDDLEDYSGESDSNDLRDLRPSLILAIAHKRAAPGEETNLIASLWNRERTYDGAARQVQRIIKDRDVREKAEELLEAYVAQAVRSLRSLRNPTLKGLLRRVVAKIFGECVIEGYCREFETRHATGGEAGAESAA